ncbi:MAG: sugar kinase [Verrucomicrobiota bacterium]
MQRLTESKLILVTRRTRVAELKRRFNTGLQAKFYVSHLGQDFSDYEQEDEHYSASVLATVQALDSIGRVQVIDRSFLPNFVFGPEDVVVVLGQDGLVANTVKYLDGQPVVGVNPDPSRWDGQLLPFQVADVAKVVPEVLQRRRLIKRVTMALAKLNTGETLHAVNDLFIGPRTHTSARYLIEHGGNSETHSSSGVIVSTGLGSTGWFKSLLTGASALVQSFGSTRPKAFQPGLESVGKPRAHGPASRNGHPASLVTAGEFAWDSRQLCFVVREPFPSCTTQAGIVFGRITTKQPLILTSQMPENGVIFSDGIEADFLEFRSGTVATVTLAERSGSLVI